MPAQTPAPAGLNPATFDIGNPLLDEDECQLTATVATHPATGEQRLIATVRTRSATLTCFLPRDKAETWRDLLDSKITKMTGLITAAGPLPDARPGPHPNGRHNGSRM
jgi:hypothetical protein